MGKRLPNDASRWATKGGGMRKHARSGVSHNHRLTRELNREAAKEYEHQAALRKRRRGTMYGSVKDLFDAQHKRHSTH